jgi:phosphate transport system permease protein
MALTTIGTGGVTAAESVRRSITKRDGDLPGKAFQGVLLACLLLALLVLVFLLTDVWGDASSVLTSGLSDFLGGQFTSRANAAGVFNALRGTFWIGAITIASFPVGVAAAIYLEEYATRNRLTRIIDVNIRNLAGVPSVVYGILGLTIFVERFEGFTGGASVLAAGITIAVLVLPIVIITAAEAIRAVPSSLREGGFGLGATRWEVIRTQVLPYAAPGILTGTVLALARGLGEAAPLLLIGAIDGRLSDRFSFLDPGQLTEQFTALPIAITSWAGRPLNSGFFELSAAAIVVMLAIVLMFNSVAIVMRNRFEKKRG